MRAKHLSPPRKEGGKLTVESEWWLLNQVHVAIINYKVWTTYFSKSLIREAFSVHKDLQKYPKPLGYKTTTKIYIQNYGKEIARESVCQNITAQKATIHQLTTMLATGAWEIIKVSGHQHWWLGPWNWTFLEMAGMVVSWWIVAFLSMGMYKTLGGKKRTSAVFVQKHWSLLQFLTWQY